MAKVKLWIFPSRWMRIIITFFLKEGHFKAPTSSYKWYSHDIPMLWAMIWYPLLKKGPQKIDSRFEKWWNHLCLYTRNLLGIYYNLLGITRNLLWMVIATPNHEMTPSFGGCYDHSWNSHVLSVTRTEQKTQRRNGHPRHTFRRLGRQATCQDRPKTFLGHNLENHMFFMGKSTISMAIINSKLLNYQRVYQWDIDHGTLLI